MFWKKRKEKKEAVSGTERKKKTENKLEQLGIAYNPYLPLLEEAGEVKLKPVETICARAVACLISTQLGCDVHNNDYEESRTFFDGLLEGYRVKAALLPTEKRLFDGTYSEQDVADVVWTYEAYWALVWALGMIEDISDASQLCDCDTAIHLVSDCKSFDEFKGLCRPRSADEILDMLDLYYRYHWACTEKRLNPNTAIGRLNPEVVVERRRGLEWLFSEENDWFDIPMDT